MYEFVQAVAKLFVRIVFRVRVFGLEHVPASGPLILCSNHQSNWDPVMVGALTPPPVSFMAKEELFMLAPVRWFLLQLHAFPVKRGQGDRGAIRASLGVLEQNGILVMFPEGTRKNRGDMSHLEGGVSFLALRSKAPILPVIITGDYRPFRRMTMQYFPPFDPVADAREAARAPVALSRDATGDLSLSGVEAVSPRVTVDQVTLAIQRRFMAFRKEVP